MNRGCLIILSLFFMGQLKAQAQQQYLRGTVEYVDEEGQYVKLADGIWVTIKGYGLKAYTDNDGAFVIGLPDKSLIPGTPIILHVDVEGYQVYEPEGGKHTLLSYGLPIEVKLAPEGSLIFMTPGRVKALIAEARAEGYKEGVNTREGQLVTLSPDQFEQLLGEVGNGRNNMATNVVAEEQSQQTNGENIENGLIPAKMKTLSAEDIERLISQAMGAARRKVVIDRKPNEDAVDSYIEEWAKLYGFSVAEVQEEIELWAEQIQRNSTDYREIGLALTAKGHYPEAAEAFGKSGDMYEREFDRLIHETRELSLNVVQDYSAQGYELYYEGDYEGALVAFRKAHSYSDRMENAWHWAATLVEIGKLQHELSIGLEKDEAEDSLNASIESYNRALEVYTSEALPRDWARTQAGLANTLYGLGVRSDGEESIRLLEAAEEAYRHALEVRTREALPQEWAVTQNNLGNVLYALGVLREGEDGVLLLEAAEEAYRHALEVRTREALPQEWAVTQNNLGIALTSKVIYYPEELEPTDVVLLLDQSLSITAQVDSLYISFRYLLAQALNSIAWDWGLNDEQLEQALSYSEKSLMLIPSEPIFLDTLAEILLRLGRYKEAREANEQARQYAGEDADLLYGIDERVTRINAASGENR